MPKPVGNSGRYMPGLDGLRAIAVIAVIAYHLNVKGMPGGLLGVSLFFVLSGYLITDLWLRRRAQQSGPQLKTFWISRAKRLLPAMIVMLALVVLVLFLFDSSRLILLRGDIGSALLYINNWWLIFHDVSYFESFGPPSPFGHLWSLAVEEQFYLLWPLVLTAALRFVPRRGQLALWTLLGAAMSAGAMALLYQPGLDPSRVYYGTDTRAFGLLIGAALAMVWPSWRLKEFVSVKGRLVLDIIGSAGMIIVLLMIAAIGEYDAFLYRGGMVLFSLATAAVVAAMAHPASRLSRIIGCLPLRWLGARSYGIYLYHYPIITLTTPVAEGSEFHLIRALLQVLMTLVVAELSWRFIEEPIRHGALSKLFSRSAHYSRKSYRLNMKIVAVFAIGILIIIYVPGASQTGTKHVLGNASDVTVDQSDVSEAIQEQKPVHIDIPTVPVNTPLPEIEKVPISKPPVEEKPVDHQQSRITAIGDSVLLDAAPYLEELLLNIDVNGKIGRQFWQAVDVVNELKKENKLGSTVIIELGTNGSFTSKQVDRLLDAIGTERKVFLVNTRVPRKWQDEVNTMIADTASKYENVSLVDWHSASKGKKSFFYADGVHLKKDGAMYLAELLSESVK
ncbi:MAG: acyltransferase family protein [Candidatus Pristimantibacillus sp.]